MLAVATVACYTLIATSPIVPPDTTIGYAVVNWQIGRYQALDRQGLLLASGTAPAFFKIMARLHVLPLHRPCPVP